MRKFRRTELGILALGSWNSRSHNYSSEGSYLRCFIPELSRLCWLCNTISRGWHSQEGSHTESFRQTSRVCWRWLSVEPKSEAQARTSRGIGKRWWSWICDRPKVGLVTEEFSSSQRTKDSSSRLIGALWPAGHLEFLPQQRMCLNRRLIYSLVRICSLHEACYLSRR